MRPRAWDSRISKVKAYRVASMLILTKSSGTSVGSLPPTSKKIAIFFSQWQSSCVKVLSPLLYALTSHHVSLVAKRSCSSSLVVVAFMGRPTFSPSQCSTCSLGILFQESRASFGDRVGRSSDSRNGNASCL